MDNQLADLMRAMQMGVGTGQGGMDTTNRRVQDPRINAVNQYMQMQGGGQMPPEMPQQQMRPTGMRGRGPLAPAPQTGMDVEGQISDMYDTTPESQQRLHEGTYGRHPAPPDPNEAFDAAGAPSGAPMSDEDMLDHVHKNMMGGETMQQREFRQTDRPSEDSRDEWPDTPEEFRRKYGREPATDSEVEYYFNEDGTPRGPD